MEELKILNKQVSEQKKTPKVKLSANNIIPSDLGKRFSKGPKLSMRLDRKSKMSIPESILVSEEEELKIEREHINQILGSFKDSERKNNQNEDTMQRIDKVNTENLKMRANKLDEKKNFNCFVQKDEDEVDCRYATFRSDMYFFGHFTLFMMGIATIFNLISYYEIDYPVFFSQYALSGFYNVTDPGPVEKIQKIIKEIEPRLETYKSYSLYSLLLCHLLSLTSQVLLIFVYSMQISLRKALMVTGLDENFVNSENLWSYLGEAFVYLLTPNYFMNESKFEIYDMTLGCSRYVKYNYLLITISLVVRTYTLVRFFILSSYFFTPRSQRFCKIYSVDHTVFFGLKCILKTYPLRFISIMFFANICIGAYIIRIYERGLYLITDVYLNNIANDIWYAFISMTTVGYGDYIAYTNPGRLTIAFIIFLGVFVISIITVLMTDTFTFKGGQLKAFKMLNQIRSKENLTEIVAKLVTKCGYIIVLARRKRAHPEDEDKYNRLIDKLKQVVERILKEIKILSETYKSDSDVNYIDIIIDQLNFVKTQVDEIRKTVKAFSKEIEESSNNNRELITIKNNLSII